MPKLSKLGDKHRLRYRVYFPDGEIVERSRLVDSVRVAREKRVLANEIEAHTASQTYSSKDVIIWHNARLISRTDRARLEGDLPGHGKTLSECLNEWEKTWSVSAEEIESRLSRRKNIEGILGKDTPIKKLIFTDGLALVNALKERGRKVAYIRKHVRDLKSAFNHQLAIRYLPYNAFATLSAGRVPAEEKIEYRILTDSEIRNVLDRAREKDLGLTTGHWPLTTGFILPRLHPETVSKAIRTLFRECGIRARLHDARHTYTTMLQDVGVPPHRAMGRTGHADMRMLSHYSHPTLGDVYENNFGFMQPEKSKKKENGS